MDIRKTILAAAGVLLAGADANAATPKTLYVDDNPVVVEGAERGSEGNPYTVIQDAVDAAAGGDTIVIAEGVYTQGETLLVDGNNGYSRVCIRKKPGLKLIGAGRGKSVIVGSRDPEVAGFVDGKDKYVRCVYVNDSANVIIEGFTLRDGEAKSEEEKYVQYGGGLSADTKKVYLVDCDIVHCCARVGGAMYQGTAVRCLIDSSYGNSGPACHSSDLINSVVTRTRSSENSRAVLNKVNLYNCTVFDNRASAWTLQGGSVAYNSIMGLNTYSGHLCRETNKLDDVVFDCVLASTAVKGTHQLAGPAVGDWRPLADSDAIGAGRYAHLETLSLPDGIDAFKDFEGNAIEADANGGVNAGAIQSKMTPAGGALHFWYNDNNLVYEINGYKTENRYETWVYPEVYPTQYCVKVQLTDGKHLYRISRKNPLTGNDSIDYPAFVPYRDGTMWMMPPIDPAMSITNTVEKAAAVFYVDDDPEKASDEEGDGSADKPFLSIQKAIDTVETLENQKTKTLIYLNPGVYTNGVFEQSTRGRFRIGVSEASRYIRIVSTEGAEKTIICGAADPETENGLGPNAIKGVHPNRNFILQDVTIADCYTDKDNKTWGGGTYGAAAYGTSSPGDYPPQFVDVVITNCHAYKSVGINYVVYKRCKFLDCSSLTEYAFADSQDTKQQFPMFACYSRNVTLHDTSSAFGLVGGSAQIYQCTFTRELGEGRLTGGANVSYNTIWYGGKNIYPNSVYTNCIVYNPAGEANGTYRKVDPLLFDNTVDGTLCFDSPAIANGESLAADNFGSNYWRYACGDINGKPIVFADGKATLGAFQTIANVVNVNVAEPVDGGWKLTGGRDYGSFRLSEGQSISFVADECARNCIGIKAGDREFRFDGNGSIVLGFDVVAQLPVKTFEAWYSTNWYVSANTDALKGPVGSDDNDGFTKETPKRTLAAAATLLYPGDVLHVAPGYYDKGEDFYDTQTTPNRVVVKSNTSIIADEGPEVTFIVGGAADGKVMRCAYVGSDAKLSGFTLTGGTNDVASAYNNDPNAMGGAIIGAGRSASSIVENCVISNNFGNVGTVAICDLVACKVIGNRIMSHGCGVRQGNAYGCFFDGNIGESVLSYCCDVWNCTITTNNFRMNGDKCISVANLYINGSVINTFIGYNLTVDSQAKSATIANCVIGEGGYKIPDDVVVNVNDIIDVANEIQVFGENGAPVAGRNAAVDHGDASQGFKYPDNTDLRGFQRIMNGKMDIGCYEADWRSVYGDILSGSRKFTVTAADAQVKAVENSVEIASGSLACEWGNSSGRTATYSFNVQVAGPGELSVILNGEKIATLTGPGAQTFTCSNKLAKNAFGFTYVPAEGEEPGKAVLSAFARTTGCFAISIR